MRRYDAVVWDWNGTLLEDTGLCVDIINTMLARRGLPPVTLDFYRALIEFPVVHYYRKLGFDFTNEPFETISDEYVALYQAGWRQCSLQPCAQETMAMLRAAGVSQSVLSASKSSHLFEQLDHFRVTPLLDAVTGADNHHGRGKLHIACEHVAALGADPARTLFIGDTAHDAEVASEAGCACLLGSFGHYSGERLQHLGFPIVHNMREVFPFICPCSGLSV